MDRRGRRAAQASVSPGRVRRASRPSAGRRASPSGARTARASSGCATPPTSRSTRRAATPACRSRSSSSFAAPPPAIRDDEELLRERVHHRLRACSASLGIDADPLKSREHILLVDDPVAAPGGRARTSTSPALIAADPEAAVTTVGVLDLETFFPAKDRFDAGDAAQQPARLAGLRSLDAGRAARRAARCSTRRRASRASSIFSIAHLTTRSGCSSCRCCSNQMVGWMRTQTGTIEPARAALHGRDLRLLPAGREPAVEAAAADAAEAGARLRAGRRARHAEPGRPRLQGPVEHRHLVHRPAADRARQGARARRAGGRGGVRARSTARGSSGSSPARQAACS